MKRAKFTLEYPLGKASANILWNSISTPLGLAEWFAEGVTVKGDEYTFSWDQHEQTAYLIQTKPNTSVQFQWEEDSETDYYFELGIEVPEISGEPTLYIIDFAEKNEKDDLVLLWNKQVDELRRKTGI